MAGSSFKDFMDGMSGNKTTGSQSNQAGLDFYQWRQARVPPYVPPRKQARVDLPFGQEFPTSHKAGRKKARIPPAPRTPEDHLRACGKWVTCAATIGIIYLCVSNLHGDAEVWSIIGAVVSAPILYRILVGPLQLLLKAIVYIFLVLAIGGLVTGLIIMIREIIRESK